MKRLLHLAGKVLMARKCHHITRQAKIGCRRYKRRFLGKNLDVVHVSHRRRDAFSQCEWRVNEDE